MSEGLSKKISIYNFIFTMGIVIYHWKNFYISYSSKTNVFTELMFQWYNLLGSICLGFFFAISAYLFYLGVDSKDTLVKKIKKRLLTLGIPFIVWNILYLGYKLIYSILRGKGIDISPMDLLKGFTLEPFDGPFWYVFALLLLMAFSPLLLKLRKRPKIFLAMLLGVFFGCCAASQLFNSEKLIFSWLLRMANYLPLYLLGAYLGACKSDMISDGKYINKWISACAAVLSAVIIVYLVAFDFNIMLLSWILRVILPISLWLSVPDNVFENAKIGFPLKISFFIYAMHSLLIGILNTLFVKVVGYNSISPLPTTACHLGLLFVLYLICFSFAYIAKKILPSKLYFALSGGRT